MPSIHRQSHHRSRRQLIVGGQEVVARPGSRNSNNKYPYFVLINDDCGGSLIAPDIVLTAGHCQPDRTLRNVPDAAGDEVDRVRVGIVAREHNYPTNDEENDEEAADEESFAVLEALRHPRYQQLGDDEFRYDFSILKLNGTSTHPTIALNRQPDHRWWSSSTTVSTKNNNDSSIQVTAMGMGDTDKWRPSKSNRLREVNLTVVPNQICEHSHGRGISYQGRIGTSHLCTFEPNKDSCSYDSGSPIIWTPPAADEHHNNDALLVGMVSWGEECADDIFPAVNSRVSAASAWIDEMVCAWSSNPPMDFGCSRTPKGGEIPTIPSLSASTSATPTDFGTSSTENGWNSVVGRATSITFLASFCILLVSGGGLYARRRGQSSSVPVVASLTPSIVRETAEPFQDEEHEPPTHVIRPFRRRLQRIIGYLCQVEFWEQHLFGIGAVLALTASAIDLVEAWKERDTTGAEDGNDDDDGSMEGPLQYWDTYKSLMVSSTLLYLLDSIIHFVHERQEGTSAASTEGEDDDDDDEHDDGNVVLQKTQRMRFAVIFGVAACFDLASSVTDDEDYPWPSYIFECLSAYLFGGSAVMLLYAKRMIYCGKHSPCCNGGVFLSSRIFWLLCLGDWLYFLACAIDVIVSFFDNPSWQVVVGDYYLWAAIGGIFSSLCWFLDATMYQLAGADMFDMVLPTGGGGDRDLWDGTAMMPIPQVEEE